MKMLLTNVLMWENVNVYQTLWAKKDEIGEWQVVKKKKPKV